MVTHVQPASQVKPYGGPNSTDSQADSAASKVAEILAARHARPSAGLVDRRRAGTGLPVVDGAYPERPRRWRRPLAG